MVDIFRPDLPPQLAKPVFDLGYEVIKDTETDYYRYSARFWVEDSGLFDTPDEAAQECIKRHGSSDD